MQTKHGTLEVVDTTSTRKDDKIDFALDQIADALDWAGLPEKIPGWLLRRVLNGWKLAKYLPASPNAPKEACLVLVNGKTAVELVCREATNSIVLETAHDL